jgi:hypothetical protein
MKGRGGWVDASLRRRWSELDESEESCSDYHVRLDEASQSPYMVTRMIYIDMYGVGIQEGSVHLANRREEIYRRLESK